MEANDHDVLRYSLGVLRSMTSTFSRGLLIRNFKLIKI